jgi:hypothetical protein
MSLHRQAQTIKLRVGSALDPMRCWTGGNYIANKLVAMAKDSPEDIRRSRCRRTSAWANTGREYRGCQGTIFHRGHEWNTIRDTTPPIYLTQMVIRSRSSIKASDGTSHHQGAYSTATVVAWSSKRFKCLGDLITVRTVTRAHGFAVEWTIFLASQEWLRDLDR